MVCPSCGPISWIKSSTSPACTNLPVDGAASWRVLVSRRLACAVKNKIATMSKANIAAIVLRRYPSHFFIMLCLYIQNRWLSASSRNQQFSNVFCNKRFFAYCWSRYAHRKIRSELLDHQYTVVNNHTYAQTVCHSCPSTLAGTGRCRQRG